MITFETINNMKRPLIYICLIVMGLSILPTPVLAQHKAQVETLERELFFGFKRDAIDSLRAVYALGVDHSLLLRAEALLAIREGRNNDAMEWYNGLTPRERRVFENMVANAMIAINSYQLGTEKIRITALEKVNLGNHPNRALKKDVLDLRNRVERLLSNVQTATVVDVKIGPITELMHDLGRATRHLGRVSEYEYTTPDGLTHWEVATTSDGKPAFKIMHRLGNGSWDRENTELVEITGLSAGAVISYPFLLPDGNTLRFAVEEPGIVPTTGLGGKDLFVSRYDRARSMLLVPHLLPLPFNSPADDLLYLTDEVNDIGWVLTGRGLPTGEGRLITFKPSSLGRYDGEDTHEHALWLNPEVTGSGNYANLGAIKDNEERGEILFLVAGKAIRNEDDLKQRSAKNVFYQYLESAETLQRLKDQLMILRKRIASDRKLNKELRNEVLAIEERVEQQRIYSNGLRNEVIRLESAYK